MAKYYFKQAVKFEKHNFKDNKDFAPVHFANRKHHEVSEEIEKHPYFKSLVKAKLAIPSEDMQKPVPQESIGERNERLAKKLAEPKEEVKDLPESEEVSSDDEVEEKSWKKKGKK